MTDPITHANTVAEIDGLKARLAAVTRERDDLANRLRGSLALNREQIEACKRLEAERDEARRETDLVRSEARKCFDAAERADHFERLLRSISQISGCEHIDERLPMCIRDHIAAVERERDEWKEYGQSHARSHEEIREELDALQSRFDALHRDLACPECGCADSIDAESQECGCDSVVCAREGGKTFAQHYMDIAARNAALVKAVEGLRKFTQHDSECHLHRAAVQGYGVPLFCSCGLDAALAAAEAVVKGDE